MRCAGDETLKFVHVGCPAEMLDEIEANSADAACVQLGEIFVGERLIHVRNAAIATAAKIRKLRETSSAVLTRRISTVLSILPAV